ncbi:MAG: UDP-N-acetylglucosamine 1-carboxyvinyltransferase [Verrucomicrobia bacterium]|nr:MAG: UDP-N-acetylglucosamine 1-carboxyvinyltransferase [Verrucomicrobiota bacterium]
MDKIRIHGGHPLSGSIKISGSKNSSLPILAATLLTREQCVVHEVPDLSDTHYMLQILMHLGAQVERASGTVSVTAEKTQSVAPYDIVRKMRASVCVLGPLLGRCKEATVSLPGGCVIGDRPIDLHLKGFEALGAAVHKMGAKIEGAGTRRIIIEGVRALHGAEHQVIPDRIEAGTFLVAGAISGEGVTVKRVNPEHVRSVTDALAACGFPIDTADNAISVWPNGDARALEIKTDPYPGFPTDMQAQMCALLSTSHGTSVVTENIFPQRYMHVAELKRMGAQMRLEGATAVIDGVDRLLGAPVMASDLRASAALVLAGLKAEGITEVSRVYHIDRGYERLDEKLSELGAHIERVKEV